MGEAARCPLRVGEVKGHAMRPSVDVSWHTISPCGTRRVLSQFGRRPTSQVLCSLSTRHRHRRRCAECGKLPPATGPHFRREICNYELLCEGLPAHIRIQCVTQKKLL